MCSSLQHPIMSLHSEHVDQRAAPRRGRECTLTKDSGYIFSFFVILEEQLTQMMNFYTINFSSQHLSVQGILDLDRSVAVFCSHISYSFEMYKTYIKYITKPYEISYTAELVSYLFQSFSSHIINSIYQNNISVTLIYLKAVIMSLTVYTIQALSNRKRSHINLDLFHI